MTTHHTNRKMLKSILIQFVTSFLMAASVMATPLITMKVQDTVVAMGQPVTVKIFIDNPIDHLAAYEFMILMNRPDIASFDYSGLGCDTSGTLSSGAELIAVSDPSSTGTALKLVCLFDEPFVPPTTPPIAPQSGGVLVKLRINTFPPPFPLDDTLYLYVNENNTSFARPNGTSIGIILDTIIDTTGFKCLQWNGLDCLAWQACPDIQNCTDSIRIDSTEFAALDTNQVVLLDGKLAIPFPNCDNNGNLSVNIVDLLCVVNYLFSVFDPQICPTFHCDANGSGNVNVVDLTYLVAYLFNGGPPPIQL